MDMAVNEMFVTFAIMTDRYQKRQVLDTGAAGNLLVGIEDNGQMFDGSKDQALSEFYAK